nr:reverse transcriptase domain-containing protein [Tanacetum cinerariifolium]
MKQYGVSDDALRLSLFPYSLTHHAIAWYDRLPRNSIHSFDDMMRKFLSKYFPPSMVTKLRNEITKFEQKPHESLFEAWERYKLSNDRCPNHNMLLVTKIDTFYNGLTLSHRDTINAAAGGTFMQKTPEECYELIENMTMIRQIQTVKVVDTKCETCGGPHSFIVCPAVGGYTQETAYATTGSLPRNTVPNPRADLKAITTRSGVTLAAQFLLLLRSILNKKEKLFDLATTLVNENCSALSFPELTSTQMILELADRSTTRLAGIAEDVFVKVGKFHFSIDFVVVDYVVDPHVPLILGRPFLRIEQALIDVDGEELTLCVDDEAITFKVVQTSKYSYNDDASINRVDVINVACEEYVQEVLGFFDNSKSGNPTPILDPIIALYFPSLTPFEGGDFNLEEIKACLTSKSIPPGIDNTDFDPEGDIRLLEELLNKDIASSPLPPKELTVEEIKTVKSSFDEPPKLELKELPSHLEYAFLEGTDKLPVIISKELKDEEKSALLKVLKSHKRAIAWKIFDIKGIDPRFCTRKILMEDDFKPTVQHQRMVNLKIHEVIKKEVIKLLDPGLIYPISDSPWVSPVRCVPKKAGMTVVENKDNELIPTRYVPKVHDGHLPRYDQENDGGLYGRFLEKCHFMVKEGIVLDHKISKSEIEVNRAKVDVIAKLHHPTFVKGAVLGQQNTKHFQPIHYSSKTMTDAQAHYTTMEKELLAVVYAFEKFRPYLVLSKTIVYTDHWALKYLLAKQDAKPRLFRWILLLQEFDITIRDKKGAKNLVADHLSRIENPHRDELEKKEITETFPLETLGMIAFCGDSSTLWFSDFANYHAGNFIVKGMSSQ